MAFPGIIDRPLLQDEISIYLDNTRPIPLGALAGFLNKIDKDARTVEGMDRFFLELSDFALGSNELRFRVVGPGRLARDEAEKKERSLQAAEQSAQSASLSAKSGVAAAGAGVVSAVAAIIALSISSGSANPASYKIMYHYDVRNVYVRSNHEGPHVVSREDVSEGRLRRLSKPGRRDAVGQELEARAIFSAIGERRILTLAGWVSYEKDKGAQFKTMKGNQFPMDYDGVSGLIDRAVALAVVVHESPEGARLEVVDVITVLSDL